jgi:hypothetical protein
MVPQSEGAAEAISGLVTPRNILIAVGAYTCGHWIAVLLVVVLERGLGLILTRRGALGSELIVRSLVTSLPDAIGAAASGIATAWLVESPNPSQWVLLTAACWMLLFAGDALVQAPTWIDVVTQTLIAALPAMVCIGAGRTALWHREHR